MNCPICNQILNPIPINTDSHARYHMDCGQNHFISNWSNNPDRLDSYLLRQALNDNEVYRLHSTARGTELSLFNKIFNSRLTILSFNSFLSPLDGHHTLINPIPNLLRLKAFA
jgi:hypothetical protein